MFTISHVSVLFVLLSEYIMSHEQILCSLDVQLESIQFKLHSMYKDGKKLENFTNIEIKFDLVVAEGHSQPDRYVRKHTSCYCNCCFKLLHKWKKLKHGKLYFNIKRGISNLNWQNIFQESSEHKWMQIRNKCTIFLLHLCESWVGTKYAVSDTNLSAEGTSGWMKNNVHFSFSPETKRNSHVLWVYSLSEICPKAGNIRFKCFCKNYVSSKDLVYKSVGFSFFCFYIGWDLTTLFLPLLKTTVQVRLRLSTSGYFFLDFSISWITCKPNLFIQLF